MDNLLSTEDYQARIRERAERLWEEAGRPEGRDEQFWFEAERLFALEHPGLAPRLDVSAGTAEGTAVMYGDNS
jgi:hypothetical protein